MDEIDPWYSTPDDTTNEIAFKDQYGRVVCTLRKEIDDNKKRKLYIEAGFPRFEGMPHPSVRLDWDQITELKWFLDERE